MRPTTPVFLFIGNVDIDAAMSKLRAAHVPYRRKAFESTPANWQRIVDLVQTPGLRGVVTVANGTAWRRFLGDDYRDVALRLFEAMSQVPHIVLVHEAVMSGSSDAPDEPVAEDDEGSDDWLVERQFAGWPQPTEDQRRQVLEIFESRRITVLPYKTNAERSVLAADFLDAHERDLLFRVYVPAGRLYAEEASRLLSLFRDWLNQVGRHSIRQDGYRTSAGQVYEFYGDGSLPTGDLSRHFDDFSTFLDRCMDDPGSAAEQLVSGGLEPSVGSRIVTKYGKEARRLHIDVRHARESRLLELRHSLESEVADLTEESPTRQLEALLEQLVSKPTSFSPQNMLAPGATVYPGVANLNLNLTQQYIGVVQGSVVNSVQGSVHLGPEAKDLLTLIDAHAGDERRILESALYELEDQEARNADRALARQRLKGFLIKVSGRVGGATLEMMQKYLESRLGL